MAGGGELDRRITDDRRGALKRERAAAEAQP
jgi:hypothetical protein